MSKDHLIILNGNVITLNPEQPRAEAIAIRNGRIVAVGSNHQIREQIDKESTVIDAENKTVIPGFVDCHVHMKSFGRSLQTLDLREVRSVEEMRQKLEEYAQENPERRWILGRGWDQDEFSEGRYPTRRDLDSAVPDKPVFLTRVCGHIGVANSKALELAGITKETKVEGGRVDLDRGTGEPNGILRENVLQLIWETVPQPSLKQLEEACLLACRKAVEVGLTGVHWMVGSAREIRILQKLDWEGRLPLRVYLGIPVDLLDQLTSLGLVTGFGDDMVKIGFVKILADGSLGARTAALKEPYSDKPQTKGMLLYTQRRLDKLILQAHQAGLQLAVHAIGDRAIHTVLNSLEKAIKTHPRGDHRHRIEHCSVLNPGLIHRMKSLGLIASVQPRFIFSDFWVVDRVGKDRARWTYPLNTLMKEDLIVASGSDCPVEPINPLGGIWAATARENFEEERITVQQTVKTYTLNAAYASFDEDHKGTIEPGKLADLTVLSQDVFSIPVDPIQTAQVEMTIVDGKIVYQRDS